LPFQKELKNILSEIENSPTECDGFVRLASYLLTNHNIEHTIYCGSLSIDGNSDTIPLHFWIQASEFKIDYRARMWLGEKAPHGIFINHKGATYTGNKVELNPIDKTVFDAMNFDFRPFLPS
jgi:hypothetical protein